MQQWDELAITDDKLSRLWDEEGRSFPYLKDLIEIACVNREDSDIVVYTNADTCMNSKGSLMIAQSLQSRYACYAFRRDFKHPFEKPIADGEIHKGFQYCGKDLFAFRVGWWRIIGSTFPDMLIGVEAWDAVMVEMVERTNPGGGCAIVDLIYHQRHASFWEAARNRYRLEAQKYNLRLAYRWMRQNGINPASHGIMKV